MDISKWFYRPHYTTPELDKKIEDVEKALGFKLFIWQKTYIEYGVFRQYGETTAKIKLNAAGVQTNEVYTNKKDLYRAMNERTGGSR